MRAFIDIVCEARSFRIAITDLVLDRRSVSIVFRDVLNGRLSHSNDQPVSLTTDANGLRIGDGYHRVIEAILRGDRVISGKIDSRFSSYSDVPSDQRWSPDYSSDGLGFEILDFSIDEVETAKSNVC